MLRPTFGRFSALLLCLIGVGGNPSPAAAERTDDPTISGGVWASDNKTLHFRESGRPDAASDKPLVIFIHGTPGSSSAFDAYLAEPALQRRAHMVAVDRPGFGQSGSELVTSLEGQARAIAPLLEPATLDRAPDTPVILVGHSLGGSIAYQIAADYPDRVDGVIAVAASLDPTLGGPRWYNRLASMFMWFVPKDLKAANREIMPLGRSLDALAGKLSAIEAPVTVIHGTEDRLVSVRHLDYIREKLAHVDPKIISEQGGSHFILWQQPTIIAESIIDMLGRMRGRDNE